MVTKRVCRQVRDDGQPCGSPPLRDGEFCLWHDPEHTEEVAEARRLGGQRRRRERVVSGAYDFEGLGSIGSIQRLVEVAALDALGLENSIARVRALAYLAQVAAGLHEKGELEERLRALEAVMGERAEPATRRIRGR
jgi:hypothetical protein